jgi:hypothetical protein
MKDRTRCYGRNFSRNFERVCIVKSALTGRYKYMGSGARVKQTAPETGEPGGVGNYRVPRAGMGY